MKGIKTYKTPEELLDGEKDLARALEIMAHLKPDFVCDRLRRTKEPPYDATCLIELLGKVDKERLDEIIGGGRRGDRQSEYASGRTEDLSLTDPAYMIDTIREFGHTAQLEGFDMLLLLRYDALRKFVIAARELLDIPPEGLGDADLKEHFNKVDKKIGVSLSVEKRNNLSFNMLLAGIDEFTKRRTVFSGVEPGRGFLIESMIRDYVIYNDPFHFLTPEFDTFLSSNSDRHGRPRPITAVRSHGRNRLMNDSVDVIIAIYPTTTKAEIKAAIDRHWPDVEYFRDKLPPLPPRERIKTSAAQLTKTFCVYDAHMQGKNYKQISADLRVGEARARRMVSDIKERIKQLTKVVPVS